MFVLPVSRWIRSRRPHALLLAALFAALSACGGGGGDSQDGGNMNPPPNNPNPPGNTLAVSMTVGPSQIFPAPASSASAATALSFDTSSGASSGSVTLSGITATAVTLNDAFAGNAGPVVLTLAQSSTPNVWNVASGAVLNSTQLADLLAGKFYVLVTSSTYPDGELRGQIVPNNVIVAFASLSGDQESPPVTTSATGLATVTVNSTAKTAAVNVNTSGASTASGVEAHTSMVGGGSLLAVLVADNSTPGHWLNENVALSDADLVNFNSSRWYVNVLTPAHTSGEMRGQIAVNPPTLATLQTNIFTPLCSGCHSGAGSGLPGVQNLTTAAATFAATVNVASLEQSALLRIKPFDPDNSYLVRKVEGDATITGSPMPLGGPLTRAQIDQIRAWTAAGALNN